MMIVSGWCMSNDWAVCNSFDECWLDSLDECWLSNDLSDWLSNNVFLDKWFSLDLTVDWKVKDFCKKNWFVTLNMRNLRVESMDWISCVVDCTLEAIWVNEWVVSFNNISISWFVLWLAISGQTILNIISEWVLWVVVVVFSNFCNNWSSDFCDNWGSGNCLNDSFKEMYKTGLIRLKMDQ
jgi:hypothetical protein